MKILVISDMVSPYYWDFFNKNKFFMKLFARSPGLPWPDISCAHL